MKDNPLEPGVLENLNSSTLILEDHRLDIRGRKIIDKHGLEIGHVSDLFIDVAERKVRMIEVRAGGFVGIGDRHFLFPVDAIVSVAKNEVHLDESRDRVIGSPAYDPALRRKWTPKFYEPYYDYYGLLPYWGNDYMYPTFTREDLLVRSHDGR
jgi:sporulation protein YlmC with PRC-barrel domain